MFSEGSDAALAKRFLILTSYGDLTADYVVRSMEDIGAYIVRLNTDSLLTDWRIQLAPGKARLTSAKADFAPADISGVYYRRARPPQPPTTASPDAAVFVMRESRVALHAIYAELRCPWISHYMAVAAAENKPLQLGLASKLGFNVPETIVTNDALTARTFFEKYRRIVLKPLSYGDLGEGRVLHTTLITTWLDVYDDDLGQAPHLLQRFVEKTFDFRVTIVDDTVFACRIDSQAIPAYAIDMRRGLADDRMRHETVDLPKEVRRMCVDLVLALNLRFGAIDLVQDKQGRYWFLEINPNGQWAWIQDRLGTPIAPTIARALLSHGR